MDAGAVRAVEVRSKSLFSAGIVAVSGTFNAQDAVQLCDADGRELGRGLCNYSAAEVDKIKVSPVTSCLCGQGVPTSMCLGRGLCNYSAAEVDKIKVSPDTSCLCGQGIPTLMCLVCWLSRPLKRALPAAVLRQTPRHNQCQKIVTVWHSGANYPQSSHQYMMQGKAGNQVWGCINPIFSPDEAHELQPPHVKAHDN